MALITDPWSYLCNAFNVFIINVQESIFYNLKCAKSWKWVILKIFGTIELVASGDCSFVKEFNIKNKRKAKKNQITHLI